MHTQHAGRFRPVTIKPCEWFVVSVIEPMVPCIAHPSEKQKGKCVGRLSIALVLPPASRVDRESSQRR
ncbi:hypothetical protein DAI22_01g097200 [Oryza sativa Japonica Group]|nr:hypothetical protein DAI22_01g097200 [Oryza sativa Japonica Group]